jgi:hypothetical protein
MGKEGQISSRHMAFLLDSLLEKAQEKIMKYLVLKYFVLSNM